MDVKDVSVIVRELFAHMHEYDGLYINFANWHIGVASNIEQCRFKDHVVVSDEHAYIIRQALTANDAKSVQDYLLSLDFESDESSRKQTGVYVYACIKNLENYKAKSSHLAGCVINAAEFLKYYKMGERNFSEVFLENGNLQNEILEGINLSSARINNISLVNVSLRKVRIDYAEIKSITLENVDLSSSNLSHSRIEDSKLSHVNLRSSCLSKARLDHVFVEDSDLTDTNFDGLSVREGTDLLQPSKLINCCLIRSNFQNSTICGLAIQSSDLTESDMREAEVMIILEEDSGTVITILPRDRSGRLPRLASSNTHFNAFINQLNQNNVILHNTVMPDGRIYSNIMVE